MAPPLGEGGYHCFNRIGDVEIDLTSEQFGDRHLDYATAVKQDRTSHFAKEEKYRRYLFLKKALQAS